MAARATTYPFKEAPKEVHATLRDNRTKQLKELADIFEALSTRELGEDAFHEILTYVHRIGLIDDRNLAKIGGVERSSANRWLNGKRVPKNSILQSAILKSIADEARSRVANLNKGKPEIPPREDDTPER